MDPITSRLTTFALPRLSPGALGALSESLTERLVYGDSRLVSARAQWLSVAEDAGFVAVPDLCAALADVCPQQALQRISVSAFEQFLQGMNQIACTHPNGIFSGEMSCSDHGFTAQIQMNDIEVVNIETLLGAPLAVASLTYSAIDLVTQILLSALMPHETVSSWVAENIREDLDRLRKSGVTLEADAVYAAIEHDPDEFEGLAFHLPEADLGDILEMFTADKPLPNWMRKLPVQKNPLRKVRALQRGLDALTPRHRRHPWALYAARILAELRRTSPVSLAARRGAWEATTIEDGQTDVGQGVAIYAGSRVEGYVLDVLYNHMSEAGENPGMTFPVACLADAAFRETLSGLATGYRLLTEASQVNSNILHTTKRKAA
jgi:hypothetical protein